MNDEHKAEKRQLEPGSKVYTFEGRKCVYVGAAPDGRHIVTPAFKAAQPWDGGDVSEDAEEYYGRPEFATVLYREPPTEVYDARIQQLIQAEHEHSLRAHNARIAADKIERDWAERISRLLKYPPLGKLEALLEGRITHFVVQFGYRLDADIETYAKALEVPPGYGGKRLLRSIVLMGDGDQQRWAIRNNLGGDGDWRWAHPCESHEEAVEFITRYILDLVPKSEADTKINVWDRNCILLMADKHGVEVPDWFRQSIERAKAVTAMAAVRKAEDDLAKARAAAGLTAVQTSA